MIVGGERLLRNNALVVKGIGTGFRSQIMLVQIQPRVPNFAIGVAQAGRALARHARGRQFNSDHRHHSLFENLEYKPNLNDKVV